MNSPLFSIVVVNFNGKEYLKNCLDSILNNDYSDYEIIVVDNGSTDKSVDFIKDKFVAELNKITVLDLKENLGPAKARNEGVKISRGNYIGFLDNDTKVERDWISQALKGFESSKKIAALQCKLLFLKEKNEFDYAGEYLGSLGFLVPVANYREIDKGQYDVASRILAAKSAGMFIRKDVFKQIGGFDEDYFIFLEETDLGWRCWLAGFEVVFCPTSIVYHHFSATKHIVDKKFNNRLVRFHGVKNYILTLYKNLSLNNLIKIFPLHIFLWACLSFYLLIKGNTQSSINIWKGICWNLANLKKNTRKRASIQEKRVLTDVELFGNLGLMKKRSLFYFIEKFTRSQKEVITPENYENIICNPKD